MSGAPLPPPNYAGDSNSPPPSEKSGYPGGSPHPQHQYSLPPTSAPPPTNQQYAPPPTTSNQQYAPPTTSNQQYAPPPTSNQQYAPPPTSNQQYAPPPTTSDQQQSYYHPPQGQPQTGSYSGQQSYSQPQQQDMAAHRNSITQTAWDSSREGAPGQLQHVPAGQGNANLITDTLGTFNGGSYRIDHRDTNTLLTLQLAHGCPVVSKPGVMVAMSPTVTLKGSIKFSFKKLVVGGELAQSTYTGPGELLLAPAALGDIVPIRLDGQQTWNVSKDAFLSATQGVIKDYKAQGLGKAMFSGEGFFVYKISGQGVLFVTSLGAIIQKNMGQGEQYIVDNGHLVAWNCKYTIERVASGGIISSMTAQEGLVCRFTGPGTVFIQTRNPVAFGQWLSAHTTGGQ